MTMKIIPFDFFVINTLEMLKIDSPIFLQNIIMLSRKLFLQFKKSTTFWDNPRTQSVNTVECPTLLYKS